MPAKRWLCNSIVNDVENYRFRVRHPFELYVYLCIGNWQNNAQYVTHANIVRNEIILYFCFVQFNLIGRVHVHWEYLM